MELSDALRHRIKQLARGKNEKVYKLAIDSGITYSTISSFLTGKSNSLTMPTILHLCEGADVSLSDFFNSYVFKDVKVERKNKEYKIKKYKKPRRRNQNN